MKNLYHFAICIAWVASTIGVEAINVKNGAVGAIVGTALLAAMAFPYVRKHFKDLKGE